MQCIGGGGLAAGSSPSKKVRGHPAAFLGPAKRVMALDKPFVGHGERGGGGGQQRFLAEETLCFALS